MAAKNIKIWVRGTSDLLLMIIPRSVVGLGVRLKTLTSQNHSKAA